MSRDNLKPVLDYKGRSISLNVKTGKFDVNMPGGDDLPNLEAAKKAIDRAMKMLLEGKGFPAQVSVFEGESRLRALAPRNGLWNHSPDGFAWGYGGSGPAQLALAILADHFKSDDDRAVRLHQKFKWDCIAVLAQDHDFSLGADQVEAFVKAIEGEQK